MTLSTRRPARQPSRGRSDDGTAILEFTLVAILLFTLIFGIINFGLILSFKQDMTRAAAEGARAGAVAYPSSTALGDAQDATDEAVKAFSDRFSADGCFGNSDGVIGTEGLTCIPSVHDCGVSTYTPSDPDIPKCVTVELIYDYDAEPILAPLPIISAFLPDEIRAKSDARINE
ncbi:MAG: TadE/TadG family type IV pilus assembly protein [Acidimicrobiales bacterium]